MRMMVKPHQAGRPRIERGSAVQVRANRVLLGHINGDKLYLENLLTDPRFARKKFNAYGDEEVDVVRAKILTQVKEALDYLGDRREFWRKQEPIYCRRNLRRKKQMK